MSKKVYTLLDEEGACLAVYSSLSQLKLGVDYWIDIFKLKPKTLSWFEYKLNYSPEPLGWDWAYISPNDSKGRLGKHGAWVPSKILWGKNLLDKEVARFKQADYADSQL